MLNSKDKSVNFILRTLFLTFFSFALISCGSSGGGDDDDGGSSSSSSSSSGGTSSSSSSSSSGGVSGVEPVTPLTKSKTSNISLLGLQLNLTAEGGSEGDIEVVVGSDSVPALPALKLALAEESNSFETAIPKLQLKNGVPSISVKNVQRIIAADFTCEDGTSIKGTVSADFATGVVNSTGVVDGQVLSCTSTFQSVLETTIPGMFTVDELLEGWGTDDDKSKPIEGTGLISTTCPQGGDGFNDNNPFFKSCSGSILTNFTVTDSGDVVHKASTKITFTSTGEPTVPPVFPPVIPELPTTPPVVQPPADPAPPIDPPGIPFPPGDLPPGFPTDGFPPGFPTDGLPPGFPTDGLPTGFPDGFPTGV